MKNEFLKYRTALEVRVYAVMEIYQHIVPCGLKLLPFIEKFVGMRS